MAESASCFAVIAVASALIAWGPARRSGAPPRGAGFLLVAAGVLIAATKAALDPGSPYLIESWELGAQGALLVTLAWPQTRLERRLAPFTSSVPLLLAGLAGAAAMAAMLDPADEYQKKLLRCVALCMPWAAASVLRRHSPFDSPSGLAAALLPAAVFLSQGEKGPLLAAACFAVPLAFDRRTSLSRRLAGAAGLLATAAIAWELLLRSKGYAGITDYYAGRMLKEHADEARLFGIVADGHRLELWELALHELMAAPILGMPLGTIARHYGFDEHNSFVFFVARTGACGATWAVLYVLLLAPRIDRGSMRSAAFLARGCALLPMLAYASVGNFFNDGDYLLAVALASRLAPRGVGPAVRRPRAHGRSQANLRPPPSRVRAEISG